MFAPFRLGDAPMTILPKQVDREFKDKRVDWGAKRSRFWSRGFVFQIEKLKARGHIPFSLLTLLVQLVVCSSKFRSHPFLWKPQILQLKVFFYIPE